MAEIVIGRFLERRCFPVTFIGQRVHIDGFSGKYSGHERCFAQSHGGSLDEFIATVAQHRLGASTGGRLAFWLAPCERLQSDALEPRWGGLSRCRLDSSCCRAAPTH